MTTERRGRSAGRRAAVRKARFPPPFVAEVRGIVERAEDLHGLAFV